MAKKAFLVTFAPTTRVVVDVNKDPEQCDYTTVKIVQAAAGRIVKNGAE